MREQLQALADSRSKDMQSILELDGQLAAEQQARAEQRELICALREALATRAATESAMSERARRAEGADAALRQEAREMRECAARAQRAEAEARRASTRRRGGADKAVQTEWVSMILPLPMPKRG